MPGALTVTWSASAVPETVRALRSALVTFAAAAHVDDPPLSEVRLAVSEALTNVVMHSYRDQPEPGPVEVTATLLEDELRVVIADEGLGMRPRLDSPGAGLGLPIISSVANGLEIRPREPQGTELHLSFALTQ